MVLKIANCTGVAAKKTRSSAVELLTFAVGLRLGDSFDANVAVVRFSWRTTMDLQCNLAALFNRFVRLDVIDGLEVIDP